MLVGLQVPVRRLPPPNWHYICAKGSRPYLVAADVYRPAAIDQLQALGRQLDIPGLR